VATLRAVIDDTISDLVTEAAENGHDSVAEFWSAAWEKATSVLDADGGDVQGFLFPVRAVEAEAVDETA